MNCVNGLEQTKTIGNPFEGCTKKEFNAHMNYSAEYTDMMLYKKQEKLVHKNSCLALNKDTIFQVEGQTFEPYFNAVIKPFFMKL